MSSRWEGGLRPRTLLALGIGLVVALLALRGMVPAGAGVYYDDGIYLALAESLAEGGGYGYANLPGDVPGVKYPPLYPAVLAAAMKLLPAYPDNLGFLKSLNALLMGLAAALSFLVFTAAWAGVGSRPGTAAGSKSAADVVMPKSGRTPVRWGIVLAAFAVTALLGYGSAQSMVLATALLSEPLFLALSFAALWLSRDRSVHPAIVGLLAAGAFLTRGIGLAVVVAVLAAELFRRGVRWKRRVRRLALLALGALPPAAAWLLWSGANADTVPAPFVGQYGSYTEWYAAGTNDLFGRIAEIAAAHWLPFRANLEMLWIPDAGRGAATFVLVVLGLATLVGVVRIARRNLALAVFPFVYLAIVLAWPYEPDRFFYAIIPTLTLLLAAGVLALTERIREDLPRWGAPSVLVVAGVLLLNSLIYEIEGHANRAWGVFQAAPAAAYAPLNAWIRENTDPGAVVASGLDPHVYWETGQKAVPNFQFLAEEYGRGSGDDTRQGRDATREALVDDFEEILRVSGARWVTVIRGEGKAGATMAAFAEAHSERSRLAFEEEVAGVTGEVWEVLPPGEIFSRDDPASE